MKHHENNFNVTENCWIWCFLGIPFHRYPIEEVIYSSQVIDNSLLMAYLSNLSEESHDKRYLKAQEEYLWRIYEVQEVIFIKWLIFISQNFVISLSQLHVSTTNLQITPNCKEGLGQQMEQWDESISTGEIEEDNILTREVVVIIFFLSREQEVIRHLNDHIPLLHWWNNLSSQSSDWIIFVTTHQ